MISASEMLLQSLDNFLKLPEHLLKVAEHNVYRFRARVFIAFGAVFTALSMGVSEAQASHDYWETCKVLTLGCILGGTGGYITAATWPVVPIILFTGAALQLIV